MHNRLRFARSLSTTLRITFIPILPLRSCRSFPKFYFFHTIFNECQSTWTQASLKSGRVLAVDTGEEQVVVPGARGEAHLE